MALAYFPYLLLNFIHGTAAVSNLWRLFDCSEVDVTGEK
jgi:hypothetical protein